MESHILIKDARVIDLGGSYNGKKVDIKISWGNELTPSESNSLIMRDKSSSDIELVAWQKPLGLLM